MQQIDLNDNWKFCLGDTADAWDKTVDDTGWETVSLPHDWSVRYPFSRSCSSGTGYLPGGVGWYRKHFTPPTGNRRKKIAVVFDGVYKQARVWCNGYYLGRHPNGYTGFRFDISEPIRLGNGLALLAVAVNHRDVDDSRWFTGSGINRHVHLEISDPVYIRPDSLFFTARDVSADQAAVHVSAEVVNDADRQVQATLVGTLAGAAINCRLSAASCDIPPNSRRTVTIDGAVVKPRLWSTADPFLYALHIRLSATDDATTYTDSREIKVGLRQAVFDPDRGFFLNGKPLTIKGVCLHDDAGCLGTAVPAVVWQRRLTKLKAMGCNAIRMSHNPHGPELYDLCDTMGFLVMDEAFDEWEGCKNKWTHGHNVYPPVHHGYAADFTEWHERDLTAQIRQNRNHPCIMLWSIGNEIDYPNDPYCHPLFKTMTGNNDANKPAAERQYNPARPNAERLVPLAEELTAVVKRSDPTRPVTLASAFPELSGQIGLFHTLDVIGYNYKEHYYEQDHRRFPDQPILGSENGHSLQAWKAVTDHPYIAGQFLWTGIDYLGEAAGWPRRTSSAGLLTLAGFAKPAYYFRQSLWTTKPVLRLFTGRNRHGDDWYRSWNYFPDETVYIRIYTNLPTVELRCNGRSLGKRSPERETGYLTWPLPYTEGRLEAIGPHGETDSLETVQTAAGLQLHLWQAPAAPSNRPFVAAGAVAQIEVAAVDGHGRAVTASNTLIHVTIDGPATLLGIENGDGTDLTDYSASYRRLYHGRLIIYLRRSGDGPVRLTARGSGLRTAVLILQ